MPTPPVSREETIRRFNAIEQALREGFPPPGVSPGKEGAIAVAAKRLGIPRSSLCAFLANLGTKPKPDWSQWAREAPTEASPPEKHPIIEEPLLARLRKSPATLDQLAADLQTSRGRVLDGLDALKARGVNLHVVGERWEIPSAPLPAYVGGSRLEYTSRPDGSYVFGVVADTHLCSKYARNDVLDDLYDKFAESGVDRVFHGGNWIDGEASFNKHDLLVHGMDAQCRHLAQRYPSRPGIVTYAVSGDDHEGWYSQREGVDIGRYAEQRFRDEGRPDWVDLGYMEAHINLTHAKTGKSAVLAVVHAGGGSSYADSYVVQKIIESLEGGEKPAVAIYGHYHKMIAGEYRNTWWILPGCSQDQTPFARKKRLRFVIGGAIVTLKQDAETGAITGFIPEMFRYFNQGYYNNRWSHSGDVTLPERGRIA